MRPFIGQGGFYPRWAHGRWVLQRVLNTVKGTMEEADHAYVQHLGVEPLVWCPPRRRGIPLVGVSGSAEADWALYEIQRIPFNCDGCGWQGKRPHLEVGGFQVSSVRDRGPADWRLQCPSCMDPNGSLVPDLSLIDSERIVARWQQMGAPELDHPAASQFIKDVAPVRDLRAWIHDFEPMPNELAYVGQQLWRSVLLVLDPSLVDHADPYES